MQDQLLELIAQDPASKPQPGASAEAIDALEKDLGVRLPASFRAFLRRFDGGELRAGRFHSVEHGGFDFRATLEVASLVVPGADERQVLPFADDYGGAFYCLDYRTSAKATGGEVPVVLCTDGGELEEVARTFEDFLAQDYRSPDGELVGPREPRRITVTLSAVTRREPGSWLHTPELDELGLAIRLLDPEILDDRHDVQRLTLKSGAPKPDPRATVAFSLYAPSTRRPAGGGPRNRVEVLYDSLQLLAGNGSLPTSAAGVVPRRLEPEVPVIHRVYYVQSTTPLVDDTALRLVVQVGT